MSGNEKRPPHGGPFGSDASRQYKPCEDTAQVNVTSAKTAKRIDWGHVLELAATIVLSYDTGVTLRQLFYRLVSAGVLPSACTG